MLKWLNKSILQSNNRTLVLADNARKTVSYIMCCIKKLTLNNSTFYLETLKLNNVNIKHISVEYDNVS